jgi:hypothetical protein
MPYVTGAVRGTNALKAFDAMLVVSNDGSSTKSKMTILLFYLQACSFCEIDNIFASVAVFFILILISHDAGSALPSAGLAVLPPTCAGSSAFMPAS